MWSDTRARFFKEMRENKRGRGEQPPNKPAYENKIAYENRLIFRSGPVKRLV